MAYRRRENSRRLFLWMKKGKAASQSENNYTNISTNDGGITSAAYDELAKRLVPAILSHLESRTNASEFMPFQEGNNTEMATKINQPVMINGSKI